MAVRIPNTAWHHNALVEHGRRRETRGVCVHTIEGTDEGAEAWFKNRQARGIGAHIIIGQEKNRTVQVASLSEKCWHAKDFGNAYLVGIEHEGFARYSKTEWLKKKNRKLLRASANRCAYILWYYKLGAPKRHHNVFGHVDVPGNDHTDPGRGWPWWFYLWLVGRAYRNLVKSNGKRWSR